MGRAIAAYVLPIAGSQLLQLTATTAALIALGTWGVDALAAVAAPLALLAIASALFAWCATGTMVLAARARAAGDTARINRVIAHGIGLAFILGTGGGTIAAFSAPAILHAAGVAPALLNLATAYARLLALSLPAFFLFAIYASVLQALEETRTALAMVAGYAVLLVAGLIALRIGPLGVPIAALASVLIVTICTAIVQYVRRPEFRFDVPAESFVPDAKLLHAMVRIDVPVNAQYASVALSNLAIVAIVNANGPHGAAAYVVVCEVIAWLLVPAVIFATGVFAAPHSLRAMLGVQAAICTPLAIALYLFAHTVLGLFLRDEQTLHAAQTGLYTIGWSAFALGIANVVSAEVDSYDQGAWPALITVTGVWLVLLPCAGIFASRWGMDGIWDAYALAYAAIAVVQIGVAPFLLRRPRRVREQVPLVRDRTI